jgi:hypothetical protein
VIDLGLISVGKPYGARISNDIYKEVIPRVLSSIYEINIDATQSNKTFLLPNGQLDFYGLLSGFQQFYRENSEAWRKKAIYEEAAPQLLLQAWLQRVVNGNGYIAREYALGSGRADLFIRYFYQKDEKRVEQRFVVELKVVRERRTVKTTIEEGLKQTAEYADKCNPDETHLIVVDPTPSAERDWDKKCYDLEQIIDGHKIYVWGM